MAAAKTTKQLLTVAGKGDGAAFRAAIEKTGDKALAGLAYDLDDERLFTASEAVYRLLIERDPADSAHWAGLGVNLYYHQRKPDEAAAHYTEALRRFPADDGLLQAAGVNLAWGAGRYADARPVLQAAYDAAPKSGNNRATLAWCLLCLGQVDEGLAHARGALNLLTRDADDAAERLATHTYLYLLAPAEERRSVLREIARTVAAGTTVPDWNFEPLVAQARAKKHPEAKHLPALVAVVSGEAKANSLKAWPAWQAASRLFDWPQDIEPPPALKALVRFAGVYTEDYAASFSIDPDSDAVGFCARPEAARDLAVFGKGGDGSAYAFWLVPARNPARAPIVFLPSDGGERSLVVAADLSAFLGLLGLCLPDVGNYAGDSEPWAKNAIAEWRAESPLSSREKQFRSWLKSELGIEVPTAGAAEAIVRKAQERQPAFEAWLSR